LSNPAKKKITISLKKFPQFSSGRLAYCSACDPLADLAFFDGIDVSQQSGKPVEKAFCFIYTHPLSFPKITTREASTIISFGHCKASKRQDKLLTFSE